jgi:hypothetical protein
MYHWSTMVALPEAHLGATDVAERNLVCAHGLPGTKHLDTALCLKNIAELTRIVDDETRRLMIQFLVQPERFRYSDVPLPETPAGI